MSGDRPLENDGPLARHGAKLIENGYSIVPILVGEKRPKIANWTKVASTKKQLRDWLGSGHRKSGIGIVTKWTPAVDIDVRDKDVSEKMQQIAREIFGDAPLRIGNKPKALFVYRTEQPFKKMTSKKYVDRVLDDMHQIEILCDGQQFVAYHVHPDTHKPYTWPTGGSPIATPAEDLPEITVEQCAQFIARFEEIAATMEDWEVVAGSSTLNRRAGDVDHDNVFASDVQKVDLTMDELRNRLMLIPPDLGYQDWCNVGMALYHHSDGGDEGLEIWHEWSSTYDEYDADELEEKWPTFSLSEKEGVTPITATFILARAKKAVEHTSAKLEMTLRDMFIAANDQEGWNAARNATREAELEPLIRSGLVDLAKRKLDQIKNMSTPIVEVRKALAYQPSTFDVPAWVEPYVYDLSNDRFFNFENKLSVSKEGFNAMYNRQSMTKKDILEGKQQASHSAAVLATDIYRIEHIAGTRYEPGHDGVFYDNGTKYGNLYAEHELPAMPEKYSSRDLKNIERVKNHIRHLLEKVEERHILLDWLSWVVQNPGQHVNWAILLQGTEGDGKSFFAEMMRSVMGVSNVRMLNASSLEGNFSDWTVGQCLTCIEEVRLINPQNKYEVLNKIKPYITNKHIEVHPKGGAQFNARNTTSYLLFSNFRDALPIGENSRRYCILFSRFQSAMQLAAFLAERDDYYEKLYAAIEESAGAIRKWLLNRDVSEKFKPFGNAPDTSAKKFMIRQAQPEFIQTLDDMISEKVSPLISEELLDMATLRTEMALRDVEMLRGKVLGGAMERHGFEQLGRIKVAGELRYFYSKFPDSYKYEDAHGVVFLNFDKIRKLAEAHLVDPMAPDDDEI